MLYFIQIQRICVKTLRFWPIYILLKPKMIKISQKSIKYLEFLSRENLESISREIVEKISSRLLTNLVKFLEKFERFSNEFFSGSASLITVKYSLEGETVKINKAFFKKNSWRKFSVRIKNTIKYKLSFHRYLLPVMMFPKGIYNY